jgi:acyl-CoA synthetase
MLSDHQSLVCGSHDGNLYCLNAATGDVKWSFSAKSLVYSSPCSVLATLDNVQMDVVCVCGSKGDIHLLQGTTGKQLSSVDINGEVFSSPVMWDGNLVVGSRDDNLYLFSFNESVK